MSNESMANYITDTPSEIAEYLAEINQLKQQLSERDALENIAKQVDSGYLLVSNLYAQECLSKLTKDER